MGYYDLISFLITSGLIPAGVVGVATVLATLIDEAVRAASRLRG